MGSYTDASTADLTTVVTWASSDASLLSVSNTDGSRRGLATANGAGTVTITASLGDFSASFNFTIH